MTKAVDLLFYLHRLLVFRYGEQKIVIFVTALGNFDLNDRIVFKTFLQPSDKVIENMHTGRGKGIQGHQNSSYLDSTLYGLFAFSGAFDDLVLKEVSDEVGRKIKSTLQAIVNTLRQ